MSAGALDNSCVEAALRIVPRHLFLPDAPVELAYRDQAVPTKVVAGECLSSCSQPAMVAVMLDQLQVGPGHRVLEIGAGTGYNAALLAHLTGPSGSVVSLDIDPDLVGAARANLERAGVTGVMVEVADGAGGWEAGAPYDRIVATVGVSDVAPAWVAQLAGRGRLVVPLSLRGVQQSVGLVREGDHLVSQSVVDCGFIPLRGWLQDSEARVQLPGLTGMQLIVPDAGRLDAAAVVLALGHPGAVVDTGLTLDARDDLLSLARWLAFTEPGAARLVSRQPGVAGSGPPPAVPPWAGPGPPPAIPPWSPPARERTTRVLVERGGHGGLAALLGLLGPPGAGGPVPVAVQGYGGTGQALARLVDALRAWDGAGRPSASRSRVQVWPKGARLPAEVAAPAVVDTPHARIVVLPG